MAKVGTTRREFLRDAALGAASLVLPKALGAEEAPRRKPNIIYILADDLGFADLGCYGQTKIHTPNLDRMAAEGVRFTQHYAGSTVCAPSRCCLMTGKHTGHTQIRDNFELPTEGQRPLLARTPTLPRMLQQAGYKTGLTGKWGLGGPGTSGEPNRQGFDHFFGYLCQREAHNYYPDHLWRNTERVPLDGTKYSHDLIADEALDFIREHRNAPFFLYVAFTIPHLALQVPDDSLAEYRGKWAETPYDGKKGYRPHPTPHAAYAAMVSRMDRDVGRILALLKELGLDSDTLVVFASDNGPTFPVGGADSAFFGSADGFRGLKQDLYEGGIRVPLVARWPGRVSPGRVSDHVCAMWDVMPTLGEVAGAGSSFDKLRMTISTSKVAASDLKATGDGISFLPALLGHGRRRQHVFLYWEYHSSGGSQAVRIGNWKGVRRNAHKQPDGPLELYDFATDPAEKTDVAAAHPGVVKRIADAMRTRERCAYPEWNFPPGP